MLNFSLYLAASVPDRQMGFRCDWNRHPKLLVRLIQIFELSIKQIKLIIVIQRNFFYPYALPPK